jgi:hypothetical protein
LRAVGAGSAPPNNGNVRHDPNGTVVATSRACHHVTGLWSAREGVMGARRLSGPRGHEDRGDGRGETRDDARDEDVLAPLAPLWPDDELPAPAAEPRRDAPRTWRAPRLALALLSIVTVLGVAVAGTAAVARRTGASDRGACYEAGLRAGYSTGFGAGYTNAASARRIPPPFLRRFDDPRTGGRAPVSSGVVPVAC